MHIHMVVRLPFQTPPPPRGTPPGTKTAAQPLQSCLHPPLTSTRTQRHGGETQYSQPGHPLLKSCCRKIHMGHNVGGKGMGSAPISALGNLIPAEAVAEARVLLVTYRVPSDSPQCAYCRKRACGPGGGDGVCTLGSSGVVKTSSTSITSLHNMVVVNVTRTT
jgi:hypothetical protein